MRLLFLFTVVPIVELYLLIKAGERIGTMNTIALIILTGIIGASFAKSQGAQIIRKIRTTHHQGQLPGKELLHGAMILAGGILLITPGFITDLVGFSLLFPPSRRLYTKLVLRYIKKKYQNSRWNYTGYANTSNPHLHDHDEDRYNPPDD